jgi:hypothetical protein
VHTHGLGASLYFLDQVKKELMCLDSKLMNIIGCMPLLRR